MRWVILDSAVADYRRLAPAARGEDDSQIRRELIDLANVAHATTPETPRADGREVWRVPGRHPAAKTRLIVERDEEAAVVVHVEASHRGGTIRHVRRTTGEPLGAQLRRRIDESGLTAEAVAELSGVPLADLEELLDVGDGGNRSVAAPIGTISGDILAVCRALHLRVEVLRLSSGGEGAELRRRGRRRG